MIYWQKCNGSAFIRSIIICIIINFINSIIMTIMIMKFNDYILHTLYIGLMEDSTSTEIKKTCEETLEKKRPCEDKENEDTVNAPPLKKQKR